MGDLYRSPATYLFGGEQLFISQMEYGPIYLGFLHNLHISIGNSDLRTGRLLIV
jgi:hypothetical protein